MHVWNVLHTARWKYRTQKVTIWAPSHNFIRLYLHYWGMYQELENNLLNSNISSTCPRNMVNFGPLTAEICWRVGAPQQISTGFASWLSYCTDVTHRRSPKLFKMFGHLLGWYTVCTFWGLLPPDGILRSRRRFGDKAPCCIGTPVLR